MVRDFLRDLGPVPTPNSDQFGEAKLSKDHKKIWLLVIKFTGIYKGVVTLPVDQDDPVADVIQDLAAGFGAMLTRKMVTISKNQGRPEEKESIEGAIREAL